MTFIQISAEKAKGQFKIIADRFISSVKTMGGIGTPWKSTNMNYRIWSFKNMQEMLWESRKRKHPALMHQILYHAYESKW
ncbi:MAG: hypothetical protein IPF70_16125 [Saprospiraceae bacterium]|nr:hypothetical protein [Saprospiraceae bacterium]